jgi:hypothetical protein
MDGIEAIRVAIDVLRAPSRLVHVRRDPLPNGVQDLLRIASGDAPLIQSAAMRTERSAATIREAAVFFIEQVLLEPPADSYRVLGARPDAPAADLRRNMALMMRWLHPDTSSGQHQTVFAERVTRAWEDVKTPDRRSAYDARLAAEQRKSPPAAPFGDDAKPRKSASSRSRSSRRSLPAYARHLARDPNFHRRGLLHRLLAHLINPRRP